MVIIFLMIATVMVIVRMIMRMRVVMCVAVWVGRSRLIRSRRIPLSLDNHINFGSADSTPIPARNFQTGSDRQGSHRLLQNFRRNSSLNQHAEEHVAADSGETI